jgi:hypothetical protein
MSDFVHKAYYRDASECVPVLSHSGCAPIPHINKWGNLFRFSIKENSDALYQDPRVTIVYRNPSGFMYGFRFKTRKECAHE